MEDSAEGRVKRYKESYDAVGLDGLIASIVIQAVQELDDEIWWRRVKALRAVVSDTFIMLADAIGHDARDFQERTIQKGVRG